MQPNVLDSHTSTVSYGQPGALLRTRKRARVAVLCVVLSRVFCCVCLCLCLRLAFLVGRRKPVTDWRLD